MHSCHPGKRHCLLVASLHLQQVAGAAQWPDAGAFLSADLHAARLGLTARHPGMCCQTCGCHSGQGVLHHSDSTWQSEESEASSPAGHCLLHAVLHDIPAEHAVFHASLAGGPGAVPQKASYTASPAWAPVLMRRQQTVLLQLIEDAAGAVTQGRRIEGVCARQSRGHCVML